MSKYPSNECKLFIEDFPFIQIAKDCPVCLLNNVNCLGNCHPRKQQTAAIGPSPVSNVNTDFVLLWKAVMVDDALVVNGDQWGLLSGFWCDSTQSLLIRDWWKRLRNKILDRSFYNSGGSLTASVLVDSLAVTDEAPVSEIASKTVNEATAQMFPNLVAPHMVMLHGMTGRGKSAFLRYLIFYILRDARDAAVVDGSSSSTAEPQQEEVTNPRIAFIDRDKLAYLITTTAILPFTTQQQLKAYRPHYFFTDNVDIDNESSASLVVMALNSGDNIHVLKKYRKRFAEARDKPRSHLYMSSPDPAEMINMFSHLATKEDIGFRFDVVGGNPRLAFSKPVADPTSSHYSLVKEVVDIMFPVPAVGVRTEAWAGLKKWAVGVTSGALDRAVKDDLGELEDVLDSSTFRECVVSENDDKAHEAFSSTFMGIVAARVLKQFQYSAVFGTLMRLLGSPYRSVYYEYEAKWTFLKTSHDKKFLVKTLSLLSIPLDLVHLIVEYAVG